MVKTITSKVLPPVKVYGFEHSNSPSSEAYTYQMSMNDKQNNLNKVHDHKGGSSKIIVPKPANSGSMQTSPQAHDNLLKGATNLLNANEQAKYDNVGFPKKTGGSIAKMLKPISVSCLSGGKTKRKKRKNKRKTKRKNNTKRNKRKKKKRTRKSNKKRKR